MYVQSTDKCTTARLEHGFSKKTCRQSASIQCIYHETGLHAVCQTQLTCIIVLPFHGKQSLHRMPICTVLAIGQMECTAPLQSVKGNNMTGVNGTWSVQPTLHMTLCPPFTNCSMDHLCKILASMPQHWLSLQSCTFTVGQMDKLVHAQQTWVKHINSQQNVIA